MESLFVITVLIWDKIFFAGITGQPIQIPMLTITRTNADNADFRQLVAALDADLRIRDGEDHGFYARFNGIEMINHAMVAYQDGKPAGCGAFKPFSDEAVEIKRMYVTPEQRGKGIASVVLAGLETWAREIGMKRCVLETGMKQPEAIALYTKNGYVRIPNFGPYAGVENSVCFEKKIIV